MLDGDKEEEIDGSYKLCNNIIFELHKGDGGDREKL